MLSTYGTVGLSELVKQPPACRNADTEPHRTKSSVELQSQWETSVGSERPETLLICPTSDWLVTLPLPSLVWPVTRDRRIRSSALLANWLSLRTAHWIVRFVRPLRHVTMADQSVKLMDRWKIESSRASVATKRGVRGSLTTKWVGRKLKQGQRIDHYKVV